MQVLAPRRRRLMTAEGERYQCSPVGGAPLTEISKISTNEITLHHTEGRRVRRRGLEDRRLI